MRPGVLAARDRASDLPRAWPQARRDGRRRRAPDLSAGRQGRLARAAPALDRARSRDRPSGGASRGEDQRVRTPSLLHAPRVRRVGRAAVAKLLPLLAAPLDRARRPVTRADAPAESSARSCSTNPTPPTARAPRSRSPSSPLKTCSAKGRSRRSSQPPSTPPSPWTGSANHNPRTGEQMPPARSAKSTPRPRRPTSAASTRRTRSSSGECSAARVANLPLALWPCAQRTSQWQRHGRFLPESNRHPAKMLPEIARRVIAAYSDPGDLSLTRCAGSRPR